MTDASFDQLHPRKEAGKFTETGRVDPGQDVLGDVRPVRGATFVHQSFADPNWRPGPGQRWSDGAAAAMVVTAVREGRVYYCYAGDTKGAWHLPEADFVARYGGQMVTPPASSGPQPGDTFQHISFGLCKIVKLDGRQILYRPVDHKGASLRIDLRVFDRRYGDQFSSKEEA